jgi:23S rRNA pseudouridine1911/1915/1917 synthase
MLLYPGGAKVAEDIPFDVIYEDDVLLGVVKPAGVLVHPARGHKTGTLYNALLFYFREKLAVDPSFHIGTIHRLDEQTSGVMVYALCPDAHGEMTRQFENRLVKKTYLCIAHGDAAFTETTFSGALGTDPNDRFRAAVDGLDARSAETRFVKVSRSACGNFSLLRAYPHTGRTHQIRAHAAALGLPLAGDPLYGGPTEHASFGGAIARCCLHAESLAITHPVTKLPMTLCAPVPEDMAGMMERLGFERTLL